MQPVRTFKNHKCIFDKLRQRYSTIRTWDSDPRIGIISSATERKRIVCNLPFENQLFGYIRYCTEISEIYINLLSNTCNLHREFRFIFSSVHLSENAQNVHFRGAKFQNFSGDHAPGSDKNRYQYHKKITVYTIKLLVRIG